MDNKDSIGKPSTLQIVRGLSMPPVQTVRPPQHGGQQRNADHDWLRFMMLLFQHKMRNSISF